MLSVLISKFSSVYSAMDMALLQYFTSIPREQLPNPEGSLSVAVPPAAIHAANDCVRGRGQTDEGAKRKQGSYMKLSSEKRAGIDKYASDNGVRIIKVSLSRCKMFNFSWIYRCANV